MLADVEGGGDSYSGARGARAVGTLLRTPSDIQTKLNSLASLRNSNFNPGANLTEL